MTAGTALRASLTIPGQPEHVQDARQFVTRTISAGHPCTDLAVLLSSEIVTNSVVHSDSGRPGGTVTITVTGIPDGVRVEVLDAGGASFPHVGGMPGALAEGGNGLFLVSELSARWGHQSDGASVVTWFEVSAEPWPAAESYPSLVACSARSPAPSRRGQSRPRRPAEEGTPHRRSPGLRRSCASSDAWLAVR